MHSGILTLMHDCIRLSGMFFMLAIGGGSAEMKHLADGETSERARTTRSWVKEHFSATKRVLR